MNCILTYYFYILIDLSVIGSFPLITGEFNGYQRPFVSEYQYTFSRHEFTFLLTYSPDPE